MSKTKKVLIIVSGRPRNIKGMNWHGLTSAISERIPEADIKVTALDELTYVTGEGRSAIYDDDQGFDLADFDLVVIRTIHEFRELAVAVAHYLKHKGVKFIDTFTLSEGEGKISRSFMVDDKVPVPLAIFAPNKTALFSAIDKFKIDFPLVFKADLGAKGNDNYLIRNRDELDEVASNSEVDMLAQRFIPNKGDYRILVLNGKARFAMLRRGQEGSYLNNTSKGGTADLAEIDDLPKELVADAEYTAKLARLQVAGVDAIVDSKTGNHYILEINTAPQLGTGAFNDKKLDAYAKAIEELL